MDGQELSWHQELIFAEASLQNYRRPLLSVSTTVRDGSEWVTVHNTSK